MAGGKNALIVLRPSAASIVPALIADAGQRTSRRFVEFFTAKIRNKNAPEGHLPGLDGDRYRRLPPLTADIGGWYWVDFRSSTN